MNQIATLKNFWHRFSDQWLVYKTDDPALGRKGYMVSAITLAFTVIGLISLPFLASFSNITDLGLVTIVSPFVCLGLYLLTRRGFVNLIGMITVLVVGLLGTNPIGDISSINKVGLVLLALTIVLSGLLVGGRSMFVTAVIVGAASWYAALYQSPDDPTLGPFLAVLYLVIAVVTYLLLQQLQQALNQSETYAQALEQARDNLEQEVTDRTKELQIAFDVTNLISKIIISNTNQTTLFNQIVELIQKTVNAAQVRIYLRPASADILVLQYSLGQDSQDADLARDRIEWGQGAIGAAAAQNKLIVAENVIPATVPGLDSALRTCLEMAIPLQKDDLAFGILVIQQQLGHPFAEADQALLQVIANQLSVAITNLRLIDETRQALERVEALNRRLIQGRWEATLRQKQVFGYTYTPFDVRPVGDEWLPGMLRVLVEDEAEPTNQIVVNDEGQPESEIAVAVKLRGETIGVLGMVRQDDHPWTHDEFLIVQSIAGQIGLALENARLFEETSRRAGREKVIADMTRQVWSSENLEGVMQTAVAQLGEILSASKVVIHLGTEDQLLTIPDGVAPHLNGSEA